MTKFYSRAHPEHHRSEHVGWLRAAVLGANDGIVSTASLVAGVAAANASHASIITTAIAGLVARAMPMAAGEFVSVHSQADTEKADLAREREELATSPEAEHQELADIYIRRGLDHQLAEQVATQLMAHDALGAHARDELGISETSSTNPLQAAIASAGSFTVGAAMPLVVVLLAPAASLFFWTVTTSIFFLALLGITAAVIGATPIVKSTLRVAFWGAFAIAVTAGVSTLFGVTP